MRLGLLTCANGALGYLVSNRILHSDDPKPTLEDGHEQLRRCVEILKMTLSNQHLGEFAVTWEEDGMFLINRELRITDTTTYSQDSVRI